MTDVVNTLHHRQSSVSVDREIFNITFEAADKSSKVNWLSCDSLSTRSNQKSFSFVIVQLYSLLPVIHLPT